MWLLSFAVATAAVLGTFGAAPAGASVETFKPIVRSHRHLVFRPNGVRPRTIRRAVARLRTPSGHRVHRRIYTRRVRRAVRRHARVRVRRRRATAGVLVLSTRRAAVRAE